MLSFVRSNADFAFNSYVFTIATTAGWPVSMSDCVFFSPIEYWSHTILSAPPSHSCISSPGLLAARTNGDWTRALNNYTRKEQECLQTDEKHEGCPSTLVQVMLDGSYGDQVSI